MMRTRYLSLHKKLFSLAMRALPCWSALQLFANSYTTVSDKLRYAQSFERSGVAFTARPIGAPPKTIPERYASSSAKDQRREETACFPPTSLCWRLFRTGKQPPAACRSDKAPLPQSISGTGQQRLSNGLGIMCGQAASKNFCTIGGALVC